MNLASRSRNTLPVILERSEGSAGLVKVHGNGSGLGVSSKSFTAFKDDEGSSRDRGGLASSRASFARMHVFLRDTFRKREPRRFVVHVKQQAVENRRRHVVDVNIGLGQERFKQVR